MNRKLSLLNGYTTALAAHCLTHRVLLNGCWRKTAGRKTASSSRWPPRGLCAELLDTERTDADELRLQVFIDHLSKPQTHIYRRQIVHVLSLRALVFLGGLGTAQQNTLAEHCEGTTAPARQQPTHYPTPLDIRYGTPRARVPRPVIDRRGHCTEKKVLASTVGVHAASSRPILQIYTVSVSGARRPAPGAHVCC